MLNFIAIDLQLQDIQDYASLIFWGHSVVIIVILAITGCCDAQICDFAVKLNNYITSSVVYFKSQWSEIRSNAATLVGKHWCASLILVLSTSRVNGRRFAAMLLHLSVSIDVLL